MKLRKILFCFIVIVGFIALTGCDDINQKIFDEASKWLNEQIPEIAVGNSIDLPSNYNIYSLDWSSSNNNIITDSGEINYQKDDVTVILYCELTIGDTIEVFEFSILVPHDAIGRLSTWFEGQFGKSIVRDYSISTSNSIYEGYTVSWSCTKPEYFSNTGQYTKPLDDEKATINYTVIGPNESREFSFDIIILGYSIADIANEIKEYISNECITSNIGTSDLVLPAEYKKLNATIEWESDSPDILNQYGVVTRGLLQKTVVLNAKITARNATSKLTYTIIVPAREIESMDVKIKAFLDAICVSEVNRARYDYYTNISNSFNHLNFFLQDEDLGVIEDIRAPLGGGNRPGKVANGNTFKLEYITIHDTANTNAGALAHANYVANGGGGVSFHYCIDEKYIYHLIPNDEVAYHAGDGTRNPYGLLDSGIKAKDGEIGGPRINISSDGYWMLNGTKSQVTAPLVSGKIATESYLTSSGIQVEVGKNGNYHIGTTWYSSSYNAIGNYGGNLNSIGIETCVDSGSDYGATFKLTAKFVAQLLIDYGLDSSRVKQHNFFSGKNCPIAIRTANKWDEFIYAVDLYKYGMTELKDVTFEWVTKSNILDNTGKISLETDGATKVDYQVKVTYNGKTTTYDYTTKLKG